MSASAVGTVAMEAAITHMASRAAVSAINNRFDVKAVAKDVTSKESLRDMARGVGVSTLTFGITEATGLGKLEPGMSRTARFQAIAERGLVRGAVSSAVTGDKLHKSLEREASLGLLAMGQSLVGDIGAKHGLKEGGAVKTGLHALVGGAYSGATTGNVASGAIGGGLTLLIVDGFNLYYYSKTCYIRCIEKAIKYQLCYILCATIVGKMFRESYIILIILNPANSK